MFSKLLALLKEHGLMYAEENNPDGVMYFSVPKNPGTLIALWTLAVTAGYSQSNGPLIEIQEIPGAIEAFAEVVLYEEGFHWTGEDNTGTFVQFVRSTKSEDIQ